MATFTVVMIGTVREVYEVEAENEEEAQQNWDSGTLLNSEAGNMELYSSTEWDE